jgi:signal transduction histidine kinase/CheY-like chemotaxis protein
VAQTNSTVREEPAEALHVRLVEAEDTLRAIRQGEIDALVVEGPGGSRVYTLEGAEQPYRMLVEEMHEGAVVLTSRGDILYANARFAALAGEPLESVVGSGFDRFLRSSERLEFQSLLRSGNGWRRFGFVGSGTGELDVRLSLSTTSPAGGAQLNLVVTDLTELKEANSGRERAERASRTKDEFLSMLAHELRTPLGAISNCSQALERTQASGERAKLHDIIARQVRHVSRLVDDLLDVERVIAGKIRLNRRPLELSAAVRGAVAVCVGDPSSDLRITVSTEPLWIDADASRLQQVVTNVVGNAMKYTPSGGRIRVSVCADGDDAVIAVEDSGLGISPQLLPFVFDLYVQADRTLDHARNGLGIGLSLVRRLVELHGGTVSASSAGAGCGSTITVRLKQLPSGAMSPSALFPGARAHSRRVLLIEDNPESRALLAKVLQLAGHQVYDAVDGARGLELLNVIYPEVAIIGVDLPDIDGYEIAKRIRSHPHGRTMLLLGLADDSERSERASEYTFDHHLKRPVDVDYLGHLISRGVEVA